MFVFMFAFIVDVLLSYIYRLNFNEEQLKLFCLWNFHLAWWSNTNILLVTIGYLGLYIETVYNKPSTCNYSRFGPYRLSPSGPDQDSEGKYFTWQSWWKLCMDRCWETNSNSQGRKMILASNSFKIINKTITQ